ncbi:uncharacterized protein LOC122641141 isoform X1 [Telopea speciosissima]|uniref:uncharacterized protein LOC122641141 isoform X1 n=1 Tax=Telopea speciosissima TaxID=54955 RepID=UPI001CC4C71F|nr:uncharacterized protein LOC122641141 isoform X1 [Telopea speciosissima]
MPPFHGNGCEITVQGPDPKLPHNCRAIMKRSESTGCGIPTEKLYEHLSSGVFLDHKRKKYWIDPKTGYNCFMLFARDLSITWGDDKSYWKWDSLQETSNVHVDIAELINVCWLEVRGNLDTSNLSPGVMYEVAFVVMLKDCANGWNVPVNFELILPNGKKQEHKVNLHSKPKRQWIEVLVGEFWTCQDMDGDMQFSILETKGGHWKSGLVIKGAIIRPKRNCDTEKPGNKHFTVISKDLSITWGDDQQYWNWYCLNETSNILVDVAELLNVWWLEVRGNFDTSNLTPRVMYEISFVVMLRESIYGWEVPVNLQLVLPDGERKERKEWLLSKPRGQWVEILVGEFCTSPEKAGDLQFSLFEFGGQAKKGLVIKGVIIKPRKSIDEKLNNDCFTLIARDLLIAWGDNNCYWRWSCWKENKDVYVEVAELLKVCSLDVHGKFDTSKLSPGIMYEVAFTVMLKDNAFGWEVPVHFRLLLPDGKTQEHEEHLLSKPRGEWIELKVGEFQASPEKAGDIQFSLFGNRKSGLIIKGVTIRPKN